MGNPAVTRHKFALYLSVRTGNANSFVQIIHGVGRDSMDLQREMNGIQRPQYKETTYRMTERVSASPGPTEIAACPLPQSK